MSEISVVSELPPLDFTNVRGVETPMKRNLQITPYYCGGKHIDDELLGEIEKSGHTLEQYINVNKNISMIAITIAIEMTYRLVMIAIEKLRGHKSMNKRVGYKMEVNRLETFAVNYIANVRAYSAKFCSHDMIMAKLFFEDLDGTYEDIRNEVNRIYQEQYHNQAKLASYLIVAHIMCEYTCGLIGSREKDIRKLSPGWTFRKLLVPNVLGDMVDVVYMRLNAMTRCEKIKPNISTEFIEARLKEIDEAINDYDNLELYFAYSIEKTEGAERLKSYGLSSYYKLHPMEDPEWIKQKEAVECDKNE